MRTLLLLALIAASAGAMACDLPTAPDRDCAAEFSCTAATVSSLTAADEAVAIERARAEVAAFIGHEVTTAAPQVEYVACPFHVRHALRRGSTCANGATLESHIRIATWQPGNVAALVQYEARNWFYIRNGHPEKAD